MGPPGANRTHFGTINLVIRGVLKIWMWCSDVPAARERDHKTMYSDPATTGTVQWPCYHRHCTVTLLPQAMYSDPATTGTVQWPCYHRQCTVTLLPQALYSDPATTGTVQWPCYHRQCTVTLLPQAMYSDPGITGCGQNSQGPTYIGHTGSPREYQFNSIEKYETKVTDCSLHNMQSVDIVPNCYMYLKKSDMKKG